MSNITTESKILVIGKHESPGNKHVICSSLLAVYDPKTQTLVCKICGSSDVVVVTDQTELKQTVFTHQPLPARKHWGSN